eukprot:TRINITY_DN34053_c0_g1_i1.p1 TRINITY_DN34053_c0_g1~~TRINITY_DN34053_c0_g1_i1.p1  ORF type:complete len:528 (-),score=98.66 TRINITY_DN34053_c0_g1_i1:167-1750(-)
MPWGKYINKVKKSRFDAAKPHLQFCKPYSIDVKAKPLGKGFGWQASKPNQTVRVLLDGEEVSAQVMTSVCAQVCSCSLSKDEFLAKAGSLPNSIVADLVNTAQAHTFSTGSFGWHSCTKHSVAVRVAGKDAMVTVNFQAVLRGTKPEGDEDDAGNDEPAAPSEKRRRPDEPAAEPANKRPRRENTLLDTTKERLKDGLHSLSTAWRSAMCALKVTDKKFEAAFFDQHSDGCAVLAQILENASKSLDIAVFCLTDDRLANTIIRKHKAGVKVRICADNDMGKELGTCDLKTLQSAGIEVRSDRTDYHMHHKFLVADRKIVVNGSLNWTTGALRNNIENIVISRCSELAATFTAEFERLWSQFAPGSSGHYLGVDATWNGNIIALFFPNKGDAHLRILADEVRGARKTLDVACFLITLPVLKAAMKDAHSRGVCVRVIMDDRQARNVHGGAHLGELRGAGIEVRLDNSPYNMHHKFCVIDGKTVCNGSFNWTRQAVDHNHENLMVFRRELDLARSFKKEFERLWKEFGS